MMREIKFRAWCKEDNVMRYQDEEWMIESEYAFICFPLNEVRRSGNGEMYELMQYTGLLDKNGKEIYEGDILSDRKNFTGLVVTWSERDCAFLASGNFLSGLVLGGEVIGNIHENPDLVPK